jgi:myo-inositol-1(or 4)-monophosphatase
LSLDFYFTVIGTNTRIEILIFISPKYLPQVLLPSVSLRMLKTTLLKAAEAGAAQLQHYFEKSFTISNKEGVNNLVTEADHAAEKAIFEVIRRDFPDHFILSEESGELAQQSEYKWIIDPLDGTVNFAHGIPICAVSIGLEHNGEMIMGVVHAPFLREVYFAQKGFGATLNDRKIHVSDQKDLLKSCLVTGFPYTYPEVHIGPLEIFSKLVRQGIPVRRLGSAAIDMCWVAAGRFDGFWEFNLSPWDTAAGYIIVKEAGGRITDFNGNEFSCYQKQLLATNGRIHDALYSEITGK